MPQRAIYLTVLCHSFPTRLSQAQDGRLLDRKAHTRWTPWKFAVQDKLAATDARGGDLSRWRPCDDRKSVTVSHGFVQRTDPPRRNGPLVRPRVRHVLQRDGLRTIEDDLALKLLQVQLDENEVIRTRVDISEDGTTAGSRRFHLYRTAVRCMGAALL